MESPAGWSFLTAALAIAGLDDAERTWDFLVDLGIVGNRADLREGFLAAVAAVRGEEGELTGPSRAARVEGRLVGLGGLGWRAHQPDPHGERAKLAYDDFVRRAPAPRAPIARPFDTVFCRHCGRQTSIRGSAIERCEHCRQAPLDLRTLAVELGYSSATSRLCPTCATVSGFDPFCYYCGEAFEA
jgi:hypothetical protein